MAVTLSTINTTLVNQNSILQSTDEGVKSTSNNIDKLVSTLYADRLDRLESDKEAERGVKVKTDKAKGESNSGGMFGGLGNMFKGVGGALAGIPILGGFLISFLKFGKLLLRFGPLAFLIGTIASGVDTDELSRLFTNIGTAFKSLKTTITGWMESTDKFMTENGIQLPSLKEVQTFIVNKFNGALKGLNNIIEGDFESFGTDIKNIGITLGLLAFAFKPLGVIGLAFKALKGTLGLAAAAGATAARGAGIAGSAAAAALKPGAAAAAATAPAAAAAAATTSKTPVAATTTAKPRKFKVDKAGNYTSLKTGKPLTGAALKTAQATTAADAAAVAKKFPRFGALSKFASKIPVLGGLISAGLIANVLMGDGSKDDKIKGVSGILGGIGGAGLGALVGSLVAPGLGTIAGAIIGGLSGDMLATSLAEWLLGGKSDTLKSAAKSHELATTPNVRMDAVSDPRSTTYKSPTKPVPQNASVIGSLNAQGADAAASRSRGMGNGAPIVIQDNSVRSSSNNSALALPPLSSVDTRYNVSGFIR